MSFADKYFGITSSSDRKKGSLEPQHYGGLHETELNPSPRRKRYNESELNSKVDKILGYPETSRGVNKARRELRHLKKNYGSSAKLEKAIHTIDERHKDIG